MVLKKLNLTQQKTCTKNKLEAIRCFTKHKPHAGRCGLKNAVFCPWWPWPLPSNSSDWETKCVLCEFGAKPFSSSPEIFHTQTKKPQSDGAKTRTFRSSVHAVKTRPRFGRYLMRYLVWKRIWPIATVQPARIWVSDMSMLLAKQNAYWHMRTVLLCQQNTVRDAMACILSWI